MSYKLGYSAGLSIYSAFAKQLDAAKAVSSERCKARKPLTDEVKLRQKEQQKAWRDKRKAENLAQRELILSRR